MIEVAPIKTLLSLPNSLKLPNSVGELKICLKMKKNPRRFRCKFLPRCIENISIARKGVLTFGFDEIVVFLQIFSIEINIGPLFNLQFLYTFTTFS